MDKMFLNKYENIIIVNPELKYIGRNILWKLKLVQVEIYFGLYAKL